MRRVFLLALVLLIGHSSFAIAASEDAVLRAREGAANLLRGKYLDAITSFDKALEDKALADVRRANVLNDRGVAKWRLKMTKEAIADFNTSVELFPDYTIVYNNRGNALVDIEEYEQAVLDFTRAIELAPGYGVAFNNRGNALLMLDRKEDALKDFRKAVKLMPTNAVPYNGRGKTHTALGRPFAGVRDFSRALSLNAKYSGARENRGKANLVLKRDGDAVRDYTELIALKPETAEFHYARGRAHARMRRYKSALKDLSKAIELNRDLSDAYRERGSIFLKIKSLDKARDDLSMALTINPDDVAALIERANTYRRLNLLEDGLIDADEALTLKPGDAKALAARAQIYEALERSEEAITDYKKALEADPDIVIARIQLKKLGAEAPARPERIFIGEVVRGWNVSQMPSGSFIATNRRFPKMRVALEMYGPGQPKILGWTVMKYALRGIGLLRYEAGSLSEDSSKTYEYTAIVDLWKSRVVAVEPKKWGTREANWEWRMASVTVTDPDGVGSEITLRKAPRRPEGEQIWSNDGWWSEGPRVQRRPTRRRRQPSSGGLFDWLFQ
ncbi:MAG: tetratricopeptide repeat protein [Alphaproteobacteria bacterium]